MGAVRVNNLESQLVPTPGGASQNLAVADSVVALATLPAACSHVFVTWHTQNIRVTFDGTNPAGTSAGHLLVAGGSAHWSKERAQAAKFIRDGGSSGAVCASPLTLP